MSLLIQQQQRVLERELRGSEAEAFIDTPMIEVRADEGVVWCGVVCVRVEFHGSMGVHCYVLGLRMEQAG